MPPVVDSSAAVRGGHSAGAGSATEDAAALVIDASVPPGAVARRPPLSVGATAMLPPPPPRQARQQPRASVRASRVRDAQRRRPPRGAGGARASVNAGPIAGGGDGGDDGDDVSETVAGAHKRHTFQGRTGAARSEADAGISTASPPLPPPSDALSPGGERRRRGWRWRRERGTLPADRADAASATGGASNGERGAPAELAAGLNGSGSGDGDSRGGEYGQWTTTIAARASHRRHSRSDGEERERAVSPSWFLQAFGAPRARHSSGGVRSDNGDAAWAMGAREQDEEAATVRSEELDRSAVHSLEGDLEEVQNFGPQWEDHVQRVKRSYQHSIQRRWCCLLLCKNGVGGRPRIDEGVGARGIDAHASAAAAASTAALRRKEYEDAMDKVMAIIVTNNYAGTTPADVLRGLNLYSRSNLFVDEPNMYPPPRWRGASCPTEHVREIHHWFRWTMGVYGWSVLAAQRTPAAVMAFPRALFSCSSLNTAAATRRCGIRKTDILRDVPTSRVFRPAHLVAYDHDTASIAVVVRGSITLSGALTNLAAVPHWFTCARADAAPEEKLLAVDTEIKGYGHYSMLRSALNLYESLLPLLERAVEAHPDYEIVVSGFSLGGAAATLLAMLLKEQHFPRTRCFAFAPPPSVSYGLSALCRPYVTSVVYRYDIVPRTSLPGLHPLLEMTKAARQWGGARRAFFTCGGGGDGDASSALTREQLTAPAELERQRLFVGGSIYLLEPTSECRRRQARARRARRRPAARSSAEPSDAGGLAGENGDGANARPPSSPAHVSFTAPHVPARTPLATPEQPQPSSRRLSSEWQLQASETGGNADDNDDNGDDDTSTDTAFGTNARFTGLRTAEARSDRSVMQSGVPYTMLAIDAAQLPCVIGMRSMMRDHAARKYERALRALLDDCGTVSLRREAKRDASA